MDGCYYPSISSLYCTPEENVHSHIKTAENSADPDLKLAYFYGAIQVCVCYGLLELKATVHSHIACFYLQLKDPYKAIEQADAAIACAPQFSNAYVIKGDAYKSICDFTAKQFFSRAIESYLNGYKHSMPKLPLIICKAVIIAVNHGLQSALQLQEKLSSDQCTDVVNCLARSELEWTSQHMEYLVMKTKVPGSGVATILSSDLSAFDWKFLINIFFDCDIMQAILSLGAKIGPRDLKSIVCSRVIANNTGILILALDNSPVDVTSLNSLGMEALNLKKFLLLETLMLRGATVGASILTKRMTLQEITQNKLIYSHMNSTPEGREELIISALNNGDSNVLEDCKAPLQSCKDQLNLRNIFKYSLQGSTDKKKRCFEFIRWLLENKLVNPNGLDEQKCPLDVVLKLSKEYVAEKLELLYLLLKNGANIQHCTFPREKQTTFLHIATQFAIEQCDTNLLEVACECYPFNEVLDLTDKEKNTPYHLAMARKSSPTTIRICKILSKYPINPTLTNIHNRKPGERKIGDKKPGARDKRASDKRYAILDEAGKQFQQHLKKKTVIPKKKAQKNLSPVYPGNSSNISTRLSVVKLDVDDTETFRSSTILSMSLTTDQVLVSVKDMLVTLSSKPVSYFKPPDYKRQGSSTQSPAKVPRQEISATSMQDTLRESLSDTVVEETLISSVEEKADDVYNHFEGCPWEVECTDRVKKFLSDTKVPRQWKEAVLKKVKQIADGIPFQNRHLCGNLRSDVKLYETRFLKGGRIIWEIAIQFSSRLTGNFSKERGAHQKSYFYSEVIRLWDIIPDHDNLNRSIDRVVESIKKSKLRGKTASKLIPLMISQNHKKQHAKAQEKLTFPKYYTFGDTEQEFLEKQGPTFFPAGSTRDDEYNVITFYSIDNSFVKSMLDGVDARRDFPFKEWPKEHDIINMPQGEVSILLLGRSGTGKTTCCLYRLWNQFHNYWSRAQHAGPLMQYQPLSILQNNKVCLDPEEAIANYDKDDNKDDENCTPFSESSSSDKEDQQRNPEQVHLHQLFITKNYVLCSQMKKRFYDLAAGRNLANEHMQFEEIDVPTRLLDVNDYAYPLFLTARQFFVLLDNSLGDDKNFFPRDDTGRLKEKIVSVDYDHEDYDTLLDLEDSDSDKEYDGDDMSDNSSHKQQATSKAKLPERVEVTATYFRDKIWPKISKTTLKNAKLDPLLIWMEIKSFIKGSQHALEKKEGHLSQEEYESLGRKLASNYADQRKDIYKIFKLYVNYMKHQSEENVFDECDLNSSIYSRLNSLTDLPWCIHSIYIDEVQDFTQAELAILLRICRNPNDLFLTGDTAQSIMRGISFRFSELTNLFHCAKEKASKSTCKVPAIVVPKVKDLQINFRSHTGVLKLAASVIDLMKKFFPSSFDCLPGDEGMFPGPAPIVLDSCNISDLALVLRTNKRESSTIEFGAHQVIIVQSEEAKNNIPDILKAGIVLTVFESKGLEFDDVLLYNFFKYSQVQDEWRVVTAYIEAEENKHLVKTEGDTSIFGKPRKLHFDECQHKSLNPELKYLYTAITRAKCNLWIYDSDQSKRLPMFDFWYKQGLVKVIKVNAATVKDQATLFSATSTSEEWKLQGDYFKKKKLWEPAMKCYHRAQCLNLESEANAYSLVQQARRLALKPQEIKELYLRAAHAFLECDKLQNNYQCLDNAAKCLKNAKKYNEAAKLFIRLEQNNKAIKCFRKTNDFTVLADIKEKMGDYNGAICLLLKYRCITKALQCASEHELQISKCYHKGRIAHKYALDLSKTIQLDDQASVQDFQKVLEYLPAIEQVQYLKTVQMHERVCEILEQEKKYSEAYRVYKAQGWFDKGLALAIRQKNVDEQVTFLLFKATKEVEIDGWILKNTRESLKKIMEVHTEAQYKSMLVYGIAVQDHTLLRKVLTYYHKKNRIAHVEALSIATAKAEYDRDLHEWENIHLSKNEDLATVLLNECRSIKFIKTALKSEQKTDAVQIIHHMESFYGFEKDPIDSDVYLIPESSYRWTNQLLKGLNLDSIASDPNGLLKLEAHLVREGVLDRFEEFTKRWIAEDSLKAMEVLCKSLNRFSFHQEVISHGGHLKESCLAKLDKTCHLQAYLHILSSVFEMKEFGNTEVPFDVVEVVLNATSPQATCYIQTPTLDIRHESLKRTSTWHAKLEIASIELIQALDRKCTITLDSCDNAFKFDPWFELWRIKCMTNGCDQMKDILIKRTSELHKQACDMSVPQVYVHDYHKSTYQHLILVWLGICDYLKKDRVLPACTVCVYRVIRHIASHRMIWETTSVSNLLNILTVYTTAILTMLAICYMHNGMPGNIYIPSSYKNAVKVFLSLLGKQSLLDSCHKDIMGRQSELKCLPNKLRNLVNIIMKAMIGIQNIYFNPLKYAVSNERCLQNHEAEHFLTFVLILFGHLGLYISDDELLRFYRRQICSSIEHCTLPIVNAALERFSTCATISGCFGAVKTLLRDSKDSLRHIDVYSNQDTEAQLMKISQRRLLPISEIISRENKAVEIREFRLRPTAKPFVPSWMSGATSTTTSNQHSNTITDHEAEIELDDDYVIPSLDQETMPDPGVTIMAEEHPMVKKDFCSICVCPLRDDKTSIKGPNSICQATEDAQPFLEHCQSDEHLTNKLFYEEFELKVHNYSIPRKVLSELAKACLIQHKTSRQDLELTNVNENITEVLKEFEKAYETYETKKGSVEWREGITCMNNIQGKMESLIRKAEKRLEKSKEKQLELEREEEEEGRKEEKETEDTQEWEERDEHIPNTELDYGEMDKRNKRRNKGRGRETKKNKK